MEATIPQVALYASITAVATGVGAIPLILSKRVPNKWLALGHAFAAGLMIAASFSLIFEGLSYGAWKVILGIFLGLIFIVIADRYVESHDISIENLKGADAKAALLVLGIMTLHSFAEGIGVGVAFGDGSAFGTFISASIALHNVPEGLAIALVLVPRGVKVWKAALWSIFSSLPQPLVAIPAFVFVNIFEPFLPIGLGLAAGAMIWMSTSELIPEAMEEADNDSVGIALTAAVMVLLLFQILIG